MEKGKKFLAIIVLLAITLLTGTGCNEESWRDFQDRIAAQETKDAEAEMATLIYTVGWAGAERRSLDGRVFAQLHQYRKTLVKTVDFRMQEVDTGEVITFTITDDQIGYPGTIQLEAGNYAVEIYGRSKDGFVEFYDYIDYFTVAAGHENSFSARLRFWSQLRIPIVLSGVEWPSLNDGVYYELVTDTTMYWFESTLRHENGKFHGVLVVNEPWDMSMINFEIAMNAGRYTAQFKILDWIDDGVVNVEVEENSGVSNINVGYSYDGLAKNMSIIPVDTSTKMVKGQFNRIGSFTVSNNNNNTVVLLNAGAYSDWVVDPRLESIHLGTTYEFPTDDAKIIINPNESRLITVRGMVNEATPDGADTSLRLEGFNFEDAYGQVFYLDNQIVFEILTEEEAIPQISVYNGGIYLQADGSIAYLDRDKCYFITNAPPSDCNRYELIAYNGIGGSGDAIVRKYVDNRADNAGCQTETIELIHHNGDNIDSRQNLQEYQIGCYPHGAKNRVYQVISEMLLLTLKTYYIGYPGGVAYELDILLVEPGPGQRATHIWTTRQKPKETFEGELNVSRLSNGVEINGIQYTY